MSGNKLLLTLGSTNTSQITPVKPNNDPPEPPKQPVKSPQPQIKPPLERCFASDHQILRPSQSKRTIKGNRKIEKMFQNKGEKMRQLIKNRQTSVLQSLQKNSNEKVNIPLTSNFRNYLHFLGLFQISQRANKNQLRPFDLVKVFDWLMQITSNLYLSKNTFYTAKELSERIFSKQKYMGYSKKQIITLCAATVSLAGKIESKMFNYPNTISQIYSLNKDSIIQGEILIIQETNFHIPILTINQKIIEILTNWHHYVTSTQKELQLDRSQIEFAVEQDPLKWNQQAQIRYTNILWLFDMIQVKFYREMSTNSTPKLIQSLTISMFIWFNYSCQQFFPMYVDDKNELIDLFREYLLENYAYNYMNFANWMNMVLRIKKELNVLTNIYQLMTHSSNELKANSINSIEENGYQLQRIFAQKYHSIYDWTL